jgi:hypothetical protein
MCIVLLLEFSPADCVAPEARLDDFDPLVCIFHYARKAD